MDFKSYLQKEKDEEFKKKKELKDYFNYFLALIFVIFFSLGVIFSMNGKKIAPLFFITGFVASVLPYLLINYFQYSTYKKMEDFFPFFLRDFSEALRSGMTFPQALAMVAQIDYGKLSDEIRKASAQLSWGMPFEQVMEKMGERIKGSKIIRQAIAIIIETYKSGGDISRTMESLANSMTTIRDIKLERKAVLNQQVTVMYFVFFIFLGLVVGMDKFLIGKFMNTSASFQQQSSVPGFGGLSLNFGNVDYCQYPGGNVICAIGTAFGFKGKMRYYRSLFFLMALIEGVCIGAIIGIITDNNIKSGFKHIAIMVTASLIILTVLL